MRIKMNKTKLFLLFMFIAQCSVGQTFIPTLPIYASDLNHSLQGIKQRYGMTNEVWQRPNFDNMNLNKFIGGIAINPNNLDSIFFAVNSLTSNKLYCYNKATGLETDLGVSFTSSAPGTNTTSLPLISGENVFGITMMTIDKVLKIGYALSKNNTLYSFLTVSPYTISNLGTVSNVPANSIPFTAVEGGGLAMAFTKNLVALVNIKVPVVDTFRYVFYEINPQDLKARLAKETHFTYYGFFAGSHNFCSGLSATTDGQIYASIYDGDESAINWYNKNTNKFDSVWLVTNDQNVGDMTGAGIVTMASNILSLTINEISATYNVNTNKTKISYSYETNKSIQKSIIQASADGINFTDAKTLWLTNKTNNNIEVNAQTVPHPAKKQYYRVATTFTDGTNILSQNTNVVEKRNDLENAAISIYPNPTTSLLNITFVHPSVVKWATIIDLTGKIIVKIPFNNLLEQSNFQLEVGKYLKQTGNYLLKVQTNKGLITKEFRFM
jgi:hypothetical protein